ncbi:hypothetical protein MMC11_009063 [Xylographa trunciseda]|nr:hypothetical protein [Xylographa trunciseda]
MALEQDTVLEKAYSKSHCREISGGTSGARHMAGPTQQNYDKSCPLFALHDSYPQSLSQSPERCFVIDVESQDDSAAASNVDNGIDADLIPQLMKLVWPTAALRKRKMQCAVALLTIIAAPTCVSIMSSTGTNSIATTGAVTAIIAGGRFFFDALGN